MTKILKIESYIESCYYARLFNRNPDNFIPTSDNLPITYKGFLEEHSDRPFLNHPVVLSELSRELTSTQKVSNNYISKNLDESTNKLLIIRDIDILSLRQLSGDYIYSSAYHYWNYVSQIAKKIDLQKQEVVFIDLDAFTPNSRIPIEFKKREGTNHLIPILDTRKIGTFESLNLDFDVKSIYKNICDRLAEEIIKIKPTIPSDAISSISSYLQEINFFSVLQAYLNSNKESLKFNFLIRFIQNNQDIYTAIELDIKQVEEIVISSIDINNLLNFAKTNQKYKIVLISQYNFLIQFKNALSSDLFLLDTSQPEFEQIWQQKQLNNFPLYGQYLDKISIEVGVEPNSFWIDVVSASQSKIISYEGESKDAHKFIGKYIKDNTEKDTFPMRYQSVELPIKINDKPRIENGIEQVYEIRNQYFAETSQIDVTVSFYIRLGERPVLEVKDAQDRFIDNALINKPEYTPKIKVVSFITFEEILISRLNKSNSQISLLHQRINLTRLDSCIQEFKRSDISKWINGSKIIITNNSVESISGNLYQFIREDHLRFINFNSQDSSSIEFINKITNTNLIETIKKVCDHLARYLSRENPENFGRARNIYNFLILILGKMYGASVVLDFDFLFDPSYLPFKLPFNSNEYIKVLARISMSPKLSKKYLYLFDQARTSQNNRKYYLLPSYIWGYARVLLWYLDFRDAANWLDFKQHFRLIATNLLNEKLIDCRQDALISMIYLLSFREYNPDFCNLGSDEHKLALQVVAKFANNQVYSIQVSQEQSLNELLVKYLEGTATNQETRRLLEVK